MTQMRRVPAWRVRSAWTLYVGLAMRVPALAVSRFASSTGNAVSISPSTDLRTMRTPDQTILPATMNATIGSSRSQPVSATAPTPTSTPADVHTSVIRCCALASRVMEWYCLLALNRTSATNRFTKEATIETA